MAEERDARSYGFRKRLLLALCAAAAVVVSAGAAYFSHHRHTLRADAEKLLLATLEIKLSQLGQWREERAADALSLVEGPLFSVYLPRAAAAKPDPGAAELIRRRLEVYLRHKKYPFAAVVDSGGRTLVYAGKKPESPCPQFASLIPLVKASGRPQMGEFQLSHADDEPHLDMVAALDRTSGKELFLLLRVHPSDFLYPLLQEWSARGNTGEILLVTRDGDEVLFLNDLRHVTDAALRLRRPLAREDLPAAAGLKGFSGLFRGKDYRGVEVLSAVAPVPGTKWAMVAKMDWAEAMRGSAATGLLLALLTTALLAAAAAAGYAALLRREEEHTEELRRSEAFIRSVMDNLPIGIAVNSVSPSVEFEYMNGLFPEIYGTTREALRDPDRFWEAVYEDPGFREEIKRRVLADCASGDPARMRWEDVPVKRGERLRYVTARNVPLPDKGLMVSMAEDVTARKLAELEKDRLNTALAEKNREMENFLYITSHDLRSPLVNIQGFGQNLLERLALVKEKTLGEGAACDPELKTLLLEKIPRDLGYIAESAAKMDRLITALLRVSRLGRTTPRPERLDIDALMDRTLSHLSFRAEAEGAEIARGSLPHCFADRESVEQIFANLLENAIKHRHPDRKPVIEVAGRLAGGRAVYEFRDNGAGISDAERDKVWDIFYRADATSQGEGIGLSIVRTLAEKNGGGARMESEPGRGSVFTVELPAKKGEKG